MSSSVIRVHGARQHNLQNLDITLPRDKMIVVTGLSGFGQVVARLRHDPTPRASGATWRACPRTRGSSSARWTSPTSTPSRGCRRPSPSSRRAPRAIRAPRSGPSPRFTITSACSSARVGTPHCPDCGKPIEPQTIDQMTDRVLALGGKDEGGRAGAGRARPQGRARGCLPGGRPGRLRTRARGRGDPRPGLAARGSTRSRSTTSRSWWTGSS